MRNGTAVNVQGQPRGEMLVSPVTQTQCLYDELEVVGKWKSGDKQKSEKLLEERRGNVGVDDGSGLTTLDLASGSRPAMRRTASSPEKPSLRCS